EVLETDIASSYVVKFFRSLQEIFLEKTIGIQTFILLIGFFLAGIGFTFMFFDPIFLVIYAICVMFFGLPVLYIFMRRSAYLNRIIIATEKMAQGRL
ncbi:hypothetical protein J4G37_62005, partial [Microvirga sp. 3-52]|nr:hypothetical protein [Microvirga sp. 3-52]